MRKKVILLRHGAVELPPGRCFGQMDVPLSELGRQQASSLARLRDCHSGATVYCSDLQRARETAHLAMPDKRDIILDARLRELHMGVWEGRNWADIYQENPLALRQWSDNWVCQAPPAGESGRDLYLRVSSFCREVLANSDGPVVVVAHAGSLRALIALMGGNSVASIFDYELDHCAPLQLI